MSKGTGNTGPGAKGVALVWFRQDLRLADNAALRAAAGAVLPVYVLDEATAGHWGLGGAHRWWLHHSLVSLCHDLDRLGAPLILRRGEAATVIPALVKEVGAVAVHAGQMVEPWARQQEVAVSKALPEGVALHLHRAATLFHPGTIVTKNGGPFGIYTPFARAARAKGTRPNPNRRPGGWTALRRIPRS